MDKQLVNVTLLLVQEDIETLLAEQPQTIQHEFQKRNLYPDLEAYVLSRIPNMHVVLAGQSKPNLRAHWRQESAERQLCRERYIQEGIYWVLEKSFNQECHGTGSQVNARKRTPAISSQASR